MWAKIVILYILNMNTLYFYVGEMLILYIFKYEYFIYSMWVKILIIYILNMNTLYFYVGENSNTLYS